MINTMMNPSDQQRARSMYVAGAEPEAIAAEIREPLADVLAFLGMTDLPAGIEPPKPRGSAREIDPRRRQLLLRVPGRSPVVDGPKRQYHDPGSALGMHADLGGKVVG